MVGMQPSIKPTEPSMKPPQKPGPEKSKIFGKFMIMSLMKKVGNLFLTLETVKGNYTHNHNNSLDNTLTI